MYFLTVSLELHLFAPLLHVKARPTRAPGMGGGMTFRDNNGRLARLSIKLTNGEILLGRDSQVSSII